MSEVALRLPSRVHESSSGYAGAFLVAAAISFNFVLAFVNANIIPLSLAHVVGCEALLVATAHVVILRNYDRAVTSWYVLLGLLALIAASRWMFTGYIDPKSLRDAMLIPTFVGLGIVSGRDGINRVLLWIQSFITAVVLFEILAVDAFSSIFSIKQFYINTRGLSADSFWNTDSSLFVSATRPGTRNLFPSLNIHRASSVFLEPVSLGNYCIIIVAYVSTHARQMSNASLLFYCSTTALLLIACDGRLAVMVSVFIIVISLTPPLIKYSSIVYVPLIICLSFVLFSLGVNTASDDLSGRSALAAKVFSLFDVAAFLGISRSPLVYNADSGITYLIANQSIVGALAILLFATFNLQERTELQSKFKRSALIFLATTMLISYSYLSIKTAALLWFLLGAHQYGFRYQQNNR